MSKRTNAKYKLDRRMGENIWGRPKSPVNKREMPRRPGDVAGAYASAERAESSTM